MLTTYKANIVGAINELWNKLTALTSRVTTTESTLAGHDTQLTSVVSSVSQHEVRITYLEDNGAGGTTVVQTPGTSTTSVMSQDAVTKALAQQAPKPVNPFELTDAATITIDGSQSINFNLNNPSLVTALTFANTLPGYWYTIDITGNTTEKTLNLTAISGISFVGIEDDVITSVTIPIGGCQISYYHRSSTLRRVEVLAGAQAVPESTEAYLQALPGYGPNKHLATDANGNFYWADLDGTTPAEPHAAPTDPEMNDTENWGAFTPAAGTTFTDYEVEIV